MFLTATQWNILRKEKYSQKEIIREQNKKERKMGGGRPKEERKKNDIKGKVR